MIDRSIILESAFEKRFAYPQIKALIGKYNPDVTEIYCTTERTVRRQRFMERNQTGERHAGHMDHVNYLNDSDEEPTDKFSALELPVGTCLKIDTTHPNSVNIEKIIHLIK